MYFWELRMKAMVFRKYGSPKVLHVEDIARPVPGENQVLIKIHATSVSAGDWRMRKADPFLARVFNGLFRPKKINVLGFELSGEIVEIGQKVSRFKVGDEVFAFAGLGFGAYAEYICLNEQSPTEQGIISLKPKNLTHAEAAAVPVGALTALCFIKDNAKVKKGQDVLIYGASGSVGSFAVQFAKYFGARVTAVCSSANMEMVSDLGADRVIDYTQQDYSKESVKYDLVFDAVAKSSLLKARKVLKPEGRYLSSFAKIKIKAEYLNFIRELCHSKRLRPVIDRRYNFEDIPKAHEYVQGFHKRGNVVIEMSSDPNITDITIQ